jgi:peptidoglycan-N-acetylglucosamine deacetylase
MYKKLFAATGLLTLLFFTCVTAQDNNAAPWNNRQCAVALTYDDGLNVHLDKVIPVLDSAGFRATFYIPANSPALNKRLNEWKAIADRGHELGNHTLFHPCAGKSLKRTWVSTEYDLDNYTLKRMIDEIRLANTFLRAIDGKSTRAFAFTCGDRVIGDSSFVDSIRNDFVAARGVLPGMNLKESADLFDIRAFTVDGQSGDDLIKLVREAVKEHAFLVFLFHGVGGEHAMNIALPEHNKLIRYLKENEKDIRVAPMVDISAYISEYRKHPGTQKY